MNFICPYSLYLLLLVPAYIVLHFYFERKKTKDIIPFGNLELLSESILKIKKKDILKHLPLILKSLILISLILALGRPTYKILVPSTDSKILLLMDISISMEADDMKPDRITIAKESAKKFIKDLPKGIEIGLGLFSGNVKIVATPSEDKSTCLRFLDKLNAKKLEPGTAIGDAILAGIESFSYDDEGKHKLQNDKTIILLTDGETNIGTDPLFAAAQAKVNGITIHSIGIGNPFGTIIRGGILTRLDEFTLREISTLTKGYYFNAQNLNEMDKIYKKIRKSLKLIPKETEITFIPVIFGFILLAIYQFLRWSKFKFV